MSSRTQSLELSSKDAMLEMIEGFWVSRAACVAAEFGIPDLLKSGPKENEQLAELMGVHAPSLYRLMRANVWIIHDWDDENSQVILQNCRAAMAKTDRLLLIESVIGSGLTTKFSKFMDLAMLVMTGGRERTEAEYRALLMRAGLKLTRIIPTSTEMSLIEVQRA